MKNSFYKGIVLIMICSFVMLSWNKAIINKERALYIPGTQNSKLL